MTNESYDIILLVSHKHKKSLTQKLFKPHNILKQNFNIIFQLIVFCNMYKTNLIDNGQLIV